METESSVCKQCPFEETEREGDGERGKDDLLAYWHQYISAQAGRLFQFLERLWLQRCSAHGAY